MKRPWAKEGLRCASRQKAKGWFMARKQGR